MYKIKFILFALCFFPFICFSQKVILTGTVTDSETGESLVGTTIFISELNTGTISNEQGVYKISLTPGKYTFNISYIGFRTRRETIEINRNTTHDFVLLRDGQLEEVVISARAQDENITKVEMGVEKLSMSEIKKMPALMGEVDVIKAIQLLPGVQAAAEGSSGFSVRGGSPDQNLILIDQTTVYNASHLMGFFSVFNNDVVNEVQLYKGDLPLKYEGRLSSLLEVNTIDDIPSKFSGTGGIGLISSRLMLEGPAGEKTSWLVGGRRSYADLFLKLSNDDALNKSTLYFYDLNAKVNHRFSEKDRLSLSFYYGKDKYGVPMGMFEYGNMATSLTWSHVFSDKLYAKFNTNYARYDYSLGSDLESSEIDWKSSIADVTGRADFSWYLNENNTVSFGAGSTYHTFNPARVKIPDMDDYVLPASHALEHGMYISNEQAFNEKWKVKYGLRWSIFQNIGKGTVHTYDENYEPVDTTVYKAGKIFNTYHGFEPRLGVVYMLTESSSVKANYAHNTQFIQLANNSSTGSPLDIWFSAGPNVKPQQVNIYSAGYFRNFDDNMYETSVELYYKDMTNVIDFADHAILVANEDLESEIRTGTGRAYGAEFMVKKNRGKLTGFVNYTLSRSDRKIPEINDGKRYLSPYDKTHTVNIFAGYEWSPKWSVSATWVFATGTPATYPTGRFEIDGEYFPVYSGRNEYRKPNYHRLDVSFTYTPEHKSSRPWIGEWNFGVYNMYGKKNPWTIMFDMDKDTGLPFAEMTYLFSFVPSVTYNFKF